MRHAGQTCQKKKFKIWKIDFYAPKQVLLEFEDEAQTTRIVRDSLHPEFDETFTFSWLVVFINQVHFETLARHERVP